MSVCKKCGANNPENVVFCRNCGAQMPFVSSSSGKSPVEQSMVQPLQAQPSHPSANQIFVGQRQYGDGSGDSDRASPTLAVGGFCAIASGGLAILQGLLTIAGTSILTNAIGTSGLTALAVLLGLLEMALGLLAIRGGMFALNRKNYSWALIGSVIGIVAYAFVIGPLLGLAAVVLIALCRDEFPSSRPAQ